MVTVADILTHIESIAPSCMAENWDKIGLNCGHRNNPVHKILVALDPFPNVCQEAVQLGVDLLVTHHPLVWEQGFITDVTTQGKCLLELIEHGIAHINAHTNLDCTPGGVNDTLAGVLGLQNITVVNPAGTDSDGKEYGLLRCGTVDEQPLEAFLALVKERLGCEGLRYADGGKPVCKVCVGGGACGSELMDAYNAGCDTFVTADVKYNQFWDAKDLGMTIIDAGHYHTENPVVAVLASKIRQAFPDVSVIVSKTHRDCMKFF